MVTVIEVKCFVDCWPHHILSVRQHTTSCQCDNPPHLVSETTHHILSVRQQISATYQELETITRRDYAHGIPCNAHMAAISTPLHISIYISFQTYSCFSSCKNHVKTFHPLQSSCPRKKMENTHISLYVLFPNIYMICVLPHDYTNLKT